MRRGVDFWRFLSPLLHVRLRLFPVASGWRLSRPLSRFRMKRFPPVRTTHPNPTEPTMNTHPSAGKDLSRRAFLQATGTAAAALYGLSASAEEDSPSKRKVVVGAHPWVYAATQPGYDITPVLPRIFADMKYAGLDGIELMHTSAAAGRLGRSGSAGSRRSMKLPVIGTSFGGAMWDRAQHAAVMDDAREGHSAGWRNWAGGRLGSPWAPSRGGARRGRHRSNSTPRRNCWGRSSPFARSTMSYRTSTITRTKWRTISTT